MVSKKSYHLTLNPDLISSAERFAESKSDAVDKALKEYIARRIGHDHKQTMASQRELAEFKKELKKNETLVEYLIKKEELLSETVKQIPEIVKEIKRIEPNLKEEISQWVSGMDIRYAKVTDMDGRVKILEGKLGEVIRKKTTGPSVWQNENSIRLLENRLQESERRLTELASKLKYAKDKADVLEGNAKDKADVLEGNRYGKFQ